MRKYICLKDNCSLPFGKLCVENCIYCDDITGYDECQCTHYTKELCPVHGNIKFFEGGENDA